MWHREGVGQKEGPCEQERTWRSHFLFVLTHLLSRLCQQLDYIYTQTQNVSSVHLEIHFVFSSPWFYTFSLVILISSKILFLLWENMTFREHLSHRFFLLVQPLNYGDIGYRRGHWCRVEEVKLEITDEEQKGIRGHNTWMRNATKSLLLQNEAAWHSQVRVL